MSKTIDDLIRTLSEKQSRLQVDRVQKLDKLVTYVQKEGGQMRDLLFVCTHNSRRSQMAELLFFVIATEIGLNVGSYSAGTEVAALHDNVVAALNFWGIKLDLVEGDKNPVYAYSYKGKEKKLFSKDLKDKTLPHKNFVAVMVCSDAEDNCPFVPGSERRIHIPFKDPRHADGTSAEQASYIDTVLEIGIEMKYLANQLKEHADRNKGTGNG